MRIIRCLLITVIIATLSNCSSHKEFYRERELIHFLETNGVNLDAKHSIALFLVGSSCGTCFESTKEILKKVSGSHYKNLIIIICDGLAQTEYLKLIPTDLKLISTSVENLTKHGLLLSSDAVFFIDCHKKISSYAGISITSKIIIINELDRRQYKI